MLVIVVVTGLREYYEHTYVRWPCSAKLCFEQYMYPDTIVMHMEITLLDMSYRMHLCTAVTRQHIYTPI